MMKRLIVVTAVLVTIAACRHRVPERSVPPGTPHISWIIMYGDSDTPDREFACQSTDHTGCVVPVSRPGRQVFSDVHVYYHGVGTETTYTGGMRVGFFSTTGASPSIPVTVTVKKEQTISNTSIINIVSSAPGTYELTFDLTASQAGGFTHPVREQVSVVIK